MKNCVSDVHKEILSHEFLGVVKNVITSSRVCCVCACVHVCVSTDEGVINI